jgi:cation diffusion facilitator family transporter
VDEGYEVCALYRISVGRRISSAARVADGLHAGTDGFTSLAVLFGAGGVALGYPVADPIVGLIITVAILAVPHSVVRDMFRQLVDTAEASLAAGPGVRSVRSIRMRWIGHRLHADAELDIDQRHRRCPQGDRADYPHGFHRDRDLAAELMCLTREC